MFSPFIFWPWFTGLTFLVAGLFAVRKKLATAHRLEKLIVLGPVFFASALAAFGAEHLAGARFLMQAVPPWMPARLFWAYFVGVALVATAVSLVLEKYVRWSATLSGLMIFLFVLLIHLPRVAANPRDRLAWVVIVRDLTFAGGAWALAGRQIWKGQIRESSWLIFIGRFCIAIPLIFFAIEHFLHPEFVPGVPLGKLTPAWIPFGILWTYLTGAVLLVAGIALVLNKGARTSIACVGLWMAFLTVFFYLPIFIADQQSELIEGLNYVADTLLFSGTILLLAGALPAEISSSTRTAE